MQSELSRFLVYGLIDPRTNELRYVGKSSYGMNRPRQHHQTSARKGSKRLDRWLSLLYSDNRTLPSIIVLKTCLSERDVLDSEVSLISFFRSLDFDLTNLTAGGEGSVGYKHTQESLVKISRTSRGRVFSDESKKRMREALLRRPHSVWEKTAKSNTGKKRTEETKRRLSDANKGRVHSEVARRNMSASQIGRKQSPETIEKRVAKNTGKKRSKEFCERNSLRQIGVKKSAETCAKISAALKGKYTNSPETIAKIKAALTGKKRPPISDEWRKNMSIAARNRKGRKFANV